MHEHARSRQASALDRDVPDRLLDLRHLIEHAAHLLPTQGPITVFVHHNTLHAFENLPFDEAVREGSIVYGCQPYMPEAFYRAQVARGRILPADLAAVLMDDLGEDADVLIGFMGTRYHLRLAMLEHPLRMGSDAELRWLIAESDALRQFRDAAPSEIRARVVDDVRRLIMRDYLDGAKASGGGGDESIRTLLAQFGDLRIDQWPERTWEAFTLQLLWRTCHNGVHGVPRSAEALKSPIRHRDLFLLHTGRDTDLPVHEVLIRFCAAYLDQGFAAWPLPERDAGFFSSFCTLYRGARLVDGWLHGLPSALERAQRQGQTPLESIEESLLELGVLESEREAYLTKTILALRGWAGMLWQMETNAEWAGRPAAPGTLEGYLAVRLILERQALRYYIREDLAADVSLAELRGFLRHRVRRPARVSVDQRAYLIFQLAQVRGWHISDLRRLTKEEWTRLVHEVEAFDSLERRRVYHHAYERRYRNEALDALSLYSSWRESEDRSDRSVSELHAEGACLFQLVCCIDEREESFRRAVEEVEPRCETLGVAGFFGAAMYYRGVAEAHFRPLCPINIKPDHYVQEESIRSFEDATRLQAAARRLWGRLLHRTHVGTRTFLGGLLAGMLGSLATVPLLMRVLLPRRTARLRRLFGRIMTPPLTQLRLERTKPRPGSGPGEIGFTTVEMAKIVRSILRTIGLSKGFARLVVITGHGSSSLNNPQEAAHDCGACGGARGGPNARAFAQMANDARVRRILAAEGLVIGDDVWFVGAYHNTCDDSMTYFDIDRLPASHGEEFDLVKGALEEARKRNAHERCRRFESAPLTLSADEALRHVEGRAEDLSQTRPEYGHATNATCIVGRRSRTRGLFLDRRAFLASYDPTEDDAQSSTLASLLRAVIPVCAGINLEYYFSTVDPTGYGCGTKLPHNIASLLGVMDGAASDLRPGLPWQMVEIHEPMRVLFVVETTPVAMLSIIEGDAAIHQLVKNSWVQVATLNPGSCQIHFYRGGRFEPHELGESELPVAPSSLAWYRGWRDHLRFCVIDKSAVAASAGAAGPAR